jgi:broad specificity phosphatase PhoE
MASASELSMYRAIRIYEDSDDDVSASTTILPYLQYGINQLTQYLPTYLKLEDLVQSPLPASSKRVHFIRHALGMHNLVGEVDHSAYLFEENEDAMLAPFGIQQCVEVSGSKEIAQKLQRVETVLISPMRRTIQTANYCFPYLVNKIPWIGSELLRERSGLHPCDRRRPITELSKYYPHVDFSTITNDHDTLYSDDREPDDVVNARCRAFMEHLSQRKEKELIVVGHSSYFDQLFTQIVKVENAREEYVRFKNCEMRSLIIKF